MYAWVLMLMLVCCRLHGLLDGVIGEKARALLHPLLNVAKHRRSLRVQTIRLCLCFLLVRTSC